MARRRTARKSPPRKRFRGINVLNTAVDLYQADAVTSMFTGQGLYGTFIEPFVRTDYKKGMDNSLDIKEIFDGLTGQGLFTPGAGAGKGWVVPGGGKPAVDQLGLAGAMMAHVKSGAVPTAMKIVGSNIAKKVIRKTGVTRSMNKIVRQIGMGDLVRF